jgi:hypothetical protein
VPGPGLRAPRRLLSRTRRRRCDRTWRHVAEHQAHLPTPLAQYQQQVAGLLGDPAAIRMGGHPGQVDPPGLQLNEEQHIQPPQRNSLDGEEVARDDPCGLFAQARQVVAVRRGAGSGPWRRSVVRPGSRTRARRAGGARP